MASNQSQKVGFIDWWKSVFASGLFWGGIASLFAVALIGYAVFNFIIMPSYTRQSDIIQVPNVQNMPVTQAEATIRRADLRITRVVNRFDDDHPRDAVIQQEPRPGAQVKPGRTIYLTINSGRIPRITIPNFKELSLRQAKAKIAAMGLQLGSTITDTLPSPFANTVTRQKPAAGDSALPNSNITLWISRGLSSEISTVPSLTGASLEDAEAMLHERKLRMVILSPPNPSDEFDIVLDQVPAEGARVKAGTEIRVFAQVTEAYETVGDSLGTGN